MTRAFAAYGTKVFIDGIPVVEVSRVELGRQIVVQANYIPMSAGHQRILRAILSLRHVWLRLEMPDAAGAEPQHYHGQLHGVVRFLPSEVVRLEFVMNVAGDAADDGPEVDIIRRETWRTVDQILNRWTALDQDIAFERAMRLFFKKGNPNVADLVDVTNFDTEFREYVGGGFTVVHNSHTYHHS